MGIWKKILDYYNIGKSLDFTEISLFFCCLPSCKKYGFLVKF